MNAILIKTRTKIEFPGFDSLKASNFLNSDIRDSIILKRNIIILGNPDLAKRPPKPANNSFSFGQRIANAAADEIWIRKIFRFIIFDTIVQML